MADTPRTMKLKLVTPERVVFESEAQSVTAMTLEGQITVLPHHSSLISVLSPGEIIVRHAKQTEPIVVSGGFLEVANNAVTILADTAEFVHELDIERAKKAVELAQSLIREKKFDVREYETLKTNLDKHRVRVSAFTKWRK